MTSVVAAKKAAELAEEKNVVVSRHTLPPEEEDDDDASAAAAAAAAAAHDPTFIGRSRLIQKPSEDLISDDNLALWDETETKVSLVRAWVDFKKTKADIKAHNKLSQIRLWENGKIAVMEERLKQVKRATEAEKIDKKIKLICKAAEAKRLMVEAERHEKLFKAEKIAAKYRASLFSPKRSLVKCFGSY